jgi:adenylosuccinate synthase
VVGKNSGNARPWVNPDEQAVASNVAYGASKAGVHVLTGFLQAPAVSAAETFDLLMGLAPRLLAMAADVPDLLDREMRAGHKLLFEGAQGSLLDIDHGTYPYVTSSNCVAGAVGPGAGVGPGKIDYVLGLTKAYATRVGSGPFPTEQTNEIGAHLAKRGNEFGSVTGRPRRCGWFDAAALRRSIQINGVSGLCITKLDVLDGLDEIQLCVGYDSHSGRIDVLPFGADAVAGWLAGLSVSSVYYCYALF